jgi:hypothetical protein
MDLMKVIYSLRVGAGRAAVMVAMLASLIAVLLGAGTGWAATPTPHPPPPGSPAQPNSAHRPAVAAASDRRVYVRTDQYGIAPGQTAQRSVGCPTGTVATSGGGTASTLGSGSNEVAPRMTESRATADGSGWNVAFSNVSRTATVRYQVRATCVSSITNYRLVNQSGSANAGASSSARAECPSGTSLLGSGVQTGNTADTTLGEVAPTAQGTALVSLENRTSHPISFSAQAVCGSGMENVRVIGGAPIQVAAGTLGNVKLACPAGTFQVGGGVSGGSGLELTDFAPLGADNQEWFADMVNRGQQSGTATATVVCGT